MKPRRKTLSAKLSRADVETDPAEAKSVSARPSQSSGIRDGRENSSKLSRAALRTARAEELHASARPSDPVHGDDGRNLSKAKRTAREKRAGTAGIDSRCATPPRDRKKASVKFARARSMAREASQKDATRAPRFEHRDARKIVSREAGKLRGRSGICDSLRPSPARAVLLPAGLSLRKLKSLPLAKFTPYGAKLFGHHVAIATRGLALLAEGYSLNQAAHAQGAPVVTLFRLLHAFASGGIWALLPGKSTGRKSLITTLGITPAEISQLANLTKEIGSVTAACRVMAKMLGTRPELAEHLRRGDRIARSIPAAIHRQLNPKRTTLTGRQPRYGP